MRRTACLRCKVYHGTIFYAKQDKEFYMIAYIRGTVTWVEEGAVILDNHGIGYRICVPSTALSGAGINEEMLLYTYFSVREDAMQLYGFLSREDLHLFELLLGVSGVGPKAAMGILSSLSADDLRFAILSDDAARIARAPGIGKKTAQKVILELKDKLDLMEVFEAKAAKADADDADVDGSSRDAVLALTALGYGKTEALKAVRAACSECLGGDSETLIRSALKHI